jgi:hypothetical protein
MNSAESTPEIYKLFYSIKNSTQISFSSYKLSSGS